MSGFGKWMLKLVKGYFDAEAANSEQEDSPNPAGKADKGVKRGAPNKKDFMRKQELIDATDASGLSHVPIAPEKGKGKAGLGNSKREWYSGWSSMTTLIQKGLVASMSNPAKYMVTVEGREVAEECIMRSGLSSSPPDTLSDDEMDLAQPYADPKSKADSSGPSRAQTCMTSYPMMKWILHNHMPFQNPKQIHRDLLLENKLVKLTYPMMKWISHSHMLIQNLRQIQQDLLLEHKLVTLILRDLMLRSSALAMMDTAQIHLASDGIRGITTVRRLPPLTSGETFEEAYEVIMILDDREQFVTKGLPVGDCIWIARHKCHETEYVLDFIVERKNVDDLRSSFIDNRYRDQKLRLQKSGLKKLIYILEGDPNQSDAAESIKTACCTTEVLEGFDVLRTNGLGETLRKYGNLTKSIQQYYKSRVSDDEQSKVSASCPSFDSFVKRCQDLDKMTISDMFAIQLMQVPEVTEEIAIAVLDMYPTLLSLASAYSHLEGDVSAQEEMLRNRSDNVICATASKNIFKLVWEE
ncbi:unnamed protein product [Thlaspi arvense]|uniref:Crossover junction endonuclease MUS81 n=1 Tax=Thlaspi arvense TaxID=13288 RepID=A0AAU9T543_THLAR|nr:unnamed protein product [Thlaspi arvense]